MANLLEPAVFEFTNPSGKKVWKVEAVVGYKNGKRIRTRRTAHSKAEAKQIKLDLMKLSEAGDLRTSSNTTLKEFGLYWVNNVKAGRVKVSTQSDYRSRMEKHIFPYLGNLRLNGIRPRDIEQWMDILHKQKYSTSTINGARRVLHSIFVHARKEDLLTRNPVELTDPYKRLVGEKTQVQPTWSIEEVRAALQAARNTEFDLFLHLALTLGLRRGEILALREQDIDVDKGLVHVNGSLKEQRIYLPDGQVVTNLVRDTTKTSASNRTIGMPWPVLESLMRHRQFNSLREATAASWSNTDWIFKASNGEPLYPNNFAKRFTKFLITNQIRVIRVHDLRHTMAEIALGNNIRIEGVSETLGHSRIDTTKAIYAPKVMQLAIDTPHQLAEVLLSIEGSFGLEPAVKPRVDTGLEADDNYFE